MLGQKSRESWLHLGDKNTKFFNSVVKTENAKNHISSLISDIDNPVCDIATLKSTARDFHKQLFNHSG